MLARDVMTTDPATIAPNAPLHAVAATMVEGGVTGLPVVDTSRKLLGLVTESDLLHRLAAAEQKQHGYLWGAFHSISRQAGDYARSHGRFAADVMTLAEDLVTATEDTTAEHLAKVMEERRIRHVPIVRGGKQPGRAGHPRASAARRPATGRAPRRWRRRTASSARASCARCAASPGPIGASPSWM